MRTPNSIRSSLCILLLLAFAVPCTNAYSVLTHEEVVDMAWDSNIVPLLKTRFPDATVDDLNLAHAYAYGGSVIQDIGYYPFGSHYFSDLLHYVRTGDFVGNLIADSTDINEYAFALGALAHYCGDTVGHPYINKATAAEYPKLRKRFGKVVTYEEDPTAHLRTEFGFDVAQVAHSRFASDNYRSFIGFQVSKDLMHRAFLETYGVPMEAVLTHEDLAIATYRHSVASIIPNMTRVALVTYGKQLKAEDPTFNRKLFIYRLKQSDYRKTYGRTYQKPGIGAHIASFFVRIVPKIGPFRALRLSLPSPQDEDSYFKSVNLTVDQYRLDLDQLKHPAVIRHDAYLMDIDLDTGNPTSLGEYRLADQSYAHLLDQLTRSPGDFIPISVHDNVLAFYAGPAAPNAMKAKPQDWQKVQANLQVLRTAHLALPPDEPTPASAASASH